MGLDTKKILGISITIDSKEKILEEVEKYIKQSQKSKVKPLIIVTPNPEQIVYAQKDKSFADILNQADVALPDGIGLLIANRLVRSSQFIVHRKTKLERIPGVEIMEDLVKLAAERGYKIALIGGRGGLAVKALECLSRRTPGLAGWAEDGPEIKLDQLDTLGQFVSEIAQKIRTTGVQIVFVGLGAPKQEYFINELVRSWFMVHSKKSNQKLTSMNDEPTTMNHLVLMSVGGSFDILAGRLQRAPLLIRSIGFEWLWRLLREPWRFRRQLALLRFVFLVLKEKFRTR